MWTVSPLRQIGKLLFSDCSQISHNCPQGIFLGLDCCFFLCERPKRSALSSDIAVRYIHCFTWVASPMRVFSYRHTILYT